MSSSSAAASTVSRSRITCPRLGMKNIAVLEKGYIGGGGSGRNTAIIRSNYRTPEGVAFYDESVRLYETSRSRSATTSSSRSRAI